MTNRTSQIVFAAALLLCAAFVHAQVTVAIAPDPHPQFLDASGKPLTSGFIYTYQAGTTTLLSTYADSAGTVQNPDPIPLDVTGAPSNGSVQTGIWLANTAYKFCAYNAALVQQWCTDNVTGFLGLLNLPNVWGFQQSFTLPIVDTATDNQIVLGQGGNQTTLDAPPPTGNVTVRFPNTNDTLVGRVTTDTLANKTLNLPLFNSSTCPIVNGPGTYTCIANANPSGTDLNGLAKLINAPSQATDTAITDTGGAIGICVAACGNTGTATIQQSGGPVTCSFDGSVVAGDYVQISSSIAKSCHDAGASYPASGQVLGRVLQTAGGINNYQVYLFGPEITATGGVRTICASGAAANVNANTTSLQAMGSCSFPAGTLNTLGKSFRLSTAGAVSPNTAINSTFRLANGSTSSLAGSNSNLATEAASSASMLVTAQVTCTVRATGAFGTLICVPLDSASGAGSPTANVADFTLANVDFTSTLFVGPACSFSVASASNVCTQDILIVEQLN